MWQQIKNIYHLCWAIIANILYGFPAQKLYTIGITGTDGKTTTALLIDRILRDAGKKTACITTLGASINGKSHETGLHVTTPSSIGMQRFLRQAINEGCTHAVIEASSHALDQNRVFGIRFNVSVLTNITHEHLDYHKTMQNYLHAKLKLLRASEIAVINLDDPLHETIMRHVPTKRIITFSLKNEKADITPQKFHFETRLPGTFNRYNCLAAAAACRHAGISDEVMRSSLANFSTPKGRADIVYDKDFRVIIDFAVTPNAFEQILSESRKKTKGRLMHVFGMSGKRDRLKRPLVGAVSSRFADVIILTADDPRDEPVPAINQEIKRGIKGFASANPKNTAPESARKNLFEIDDRQEAIDFAIHIARPGDTVLLTGKAHEKSLAYPDGERPWDEYAAVESALEKMRSRKV